MLDDRQVVAVAGCREALHFAQEQHERRPGRHGAPLHHHHRHGRLGRDFRLAPEAINTPARQVANANNANKRAPMATPDLCLTVDLSNKVLSEAGFALALPAAACFDDQTQGKSRGQQRVTQSFARPDRRASCWSAGAHGEAQVAMVVTVIDGAEVEGVLTRQDLRRVDSGEMLLRPSSVAGSFAAIDTSPSTSNPWFLNVDETHFSHVGC